MTQMNPVDDNHASDASFTKRLRRHVSGRKREYFAVATPPLERICRDELARWVPDATQLTMEPGGVTFAGRLVDCLKANLYLSTATRILMRVDSFTATNLRQLERKTAAIAWELFLPSGSTPVVHVNSRRSRLYHSDAIRDAIQAAIANRWPAAPAPPTTAAGQAIFTRIVEDQVVISLDSSGEPLYKRGFKTGGARAPIRETLAAAILLASAYDPERPLVDPMCGSGTFSLEAAMLAKHMAPGCRRRFALMAWPAFSANQYAYLKQTADMGVETLCRPRIFASDLDASACRRLGHAVAANDLGDAVSVSARDLFACRGIDYAGGPGLVTINPPYGIRIGSARRAQHLFQEICRHLADHFAGWRVALIVPQKNLISHLPFKAKPIPLLHGGLKLSLAIGDIPE